MRKFRIKKITGSKVIIEGISVEQIDVDNFIVIKANNSDFELVRGAIDSMRIRFMNSTKKLFVLLPKGIEICRFVEICKKKK